MSSHILSHIPLRRRRLLVLPNSRRPSTCRLILGLRVTEALKNLVGLRPGKNRTFTVAVVNEYRRGPSQHIVRVLAGPLYLRIRRSAAVSDSAGVRGCAGESVGVAVGTAVKGSGPAVAGVVSPPGTSLPCARLGSDEGSDGLLIQFVAALGAVSGDPAGQFVRGVQRA